MQITERSYDNLHQYKHIFKLISKIGFMDSFINNFSDLTENDIFEKKNRTIGHNDKRSKFM